MNRSASRVVHLTTRGVSDYTARRHYPVNLKELRQRIESVTTITKLTNTMQMVASSRIKAATRKAEQTKLFTTGSDKILKPIVEGGKKPDSADSSLLLAVTSDKGMCGSVNGQIVKGARALVRSQPGKYNLISLGGKGNPLASAFPKEFQISLKDFGKRDLTFVEVGLAVDRIIKSTENYAEVDVLYNKFKNAVTYIVTKDTVPGVKTLMANMDKLSAYEFEEAEETTLRDLFEFEIASNVWVAYHQNKCSELAGRMTSMDNATKNANQITAALSLDFNRGRQAAITTELIEITSGASALADSE